MKVFTKDPSDILDYTRKALKFLGDDSISTSTWILDSGITKDSDSNDSNSATIFISGGKAGTTYTVTNRIVTAAGLSKDLSFLLKVEDK